MGTPVIGGDLTGSIDEGDISITGDLDDIGFGTGNTDDVFTVTTGATFGTATIDSATGTWTYTLDNSDPAVIALNPGDTLTDIFTVTMLDTAGVGAGQTDVADVTITINGVVCFCAGTLIETPEGPRRIETLRVGDLVRSLDGPAQPIRWIGRSEVSPQMRRANPKLHPVRISAGSLGAGLPERDLLVSRQHRILLKSRIAEHMFGVSEVLIPAIKLTSLPGIHVDDSGPDFTYMHLLFDHHEVIFAEGAPAESLFTGPEALKALSPEAQEEIRTLFPDFDILQGIASPARHVPPGKLQKKLVERHLKNDRDIFSMNGV
jgi:VCBS repeat-containing protein